MEGHFRVGPWLVQPSLNAISRGGMSIHLTPKAMEVLVCLAEHAGEPISKEKLLQAIWPDTFVSEDVLKGAISELRRVFEDDAKEPHIIQTIAKRGYRLIAPIEALNETARESLDLANPASALPRIKERTSAHKWWTRSLVIGAVALVIVLLGTFNVQGLRQRLIGKGSATQIHSLAVLPLQNLSADPAQEYFSDGMTDALITDLAQIGSLKVISRTSSMQYKQTKQSLLEIARELNVDGIVEGTVQRSGDRVRITAQLIQVPEDRHLWASSYEGDWREVFMLEREVAGDIAHQVQTRLTAQQQAPITSPHPANLKTLEAYLQGNYNLDRYGKGGGDAEKRKAAEYFQQAIDADSNFAPAYVGLARAHLGLFWGSTEDAAIVRTAAGRAAALDANLPDAHETLADINLASWNWSAAEREYRRAITLNPNSVRGHDGLGELLLILGRLDESWNEAAIAQELDPDHIHVQSVLDRRGQHDRAIAMLQMILKRHPDDGYLHVELFRDYLIKRMYKEAVFHASQVAVLFGFPQIADEAHGAEATAGDREALRTGLRGWEHLMDAHLAFVPVTLAEVYVSLDEKDRAFYWLEQAYEHHDIGMIGTDLGLQFLNTEVLLDPLHSDPRFKDLIRRVGLPDVHLNDTVAE